MRPGLTAKGSFKNSKSEGIAISYFHHLSEIQGFRIIIFNFIGNYVTGSGTLVKSVPLWNGEKQSRHFFPGKVWTVAHDGNKGDWIRDPSGTTWIEDYQALKSQRWPPPPGEAVLGLPCGRQKWFSMNRKKTPGRAQGSSGSYLHLPDGHGPENALIPRVQLKSNLLSTRYWLGFKG